jgi:hypothetical protein
VGPAGRDLLTLKTIEKQNWLFYKTIGKGTVIFDIGIFDSRVQVGGIQKFSEREIICWRDDLKDRAEYVAVCAIID